MIYRKEQHGIVLLKGKDTRDVKLLMTKNKPEMVEVTTRPAAYATNSALNVWTRPSKQKVTSILNFNKGEAGIDLSNQITSYAAMQEKVVKWYWKLAMKLLLDISIRNAYVIYEGQVKK